MQVSVLKWPEFFHGEAWSVGGITHSGEFLLIPLLVGHDLTIHPVSD